MERSRHLFVNFAINLSHEGMLWNDTSSSMRMLTHTCEICKKRFYRRDKLVEHRVNCQENSLKRKQNEVDSGPAPKKMRSEIQVGEGEPYHGNKEDIENSDNPCSWTGTFNDTLKKVELKPRKDQKHDLSNFLRLIIYLQPYLTKNLEEKRGLKWFIGVKVQFVKHKPDGEDIFSEPHFRSLCTTVHLHDLEEQVQQAKQKVVQSCVMYQRGERLGSRWSSSYGS